MYQVFCIQYSVGLLHPSSQATLKGEQYPTHAICPTQIQLEQGPSIELYSHKMENSRTKSNPLAIGQNIAKTKPKAVKPYERSKSLDFAHCCY